MSWSILEKTLSAHRPEVRLRAPVADEELDDVLLTDEQRRRLAEAGLASFDDSDTTPPVGNGLWSRVRRLFS